jgi:hypothetical protein
MQPKTRVISTPVLLGLSVLCCLVLYQFADLTPANSPLPAWVISSMAEARSTGRPEGPVPVAAGVASQTAPALEPPTISRPSPDLTAMPSKEATTEAAETNGGAQSAPALLSPAAPAVSSDIASPEPEQARLAQIEADRQAAAQKKAAAEREAQVEDRLQGARLQEAQRASAGFEAELLAAERRRALQAAAEAAAEKKAAAEREAQVEDRLQGARLQEAQRASAGFEAERLAVERRRALQAASEAAAAKQAQLARIEADRQAAAEKKAAAEREAQVEDRLQGARLREAERASAGFELARRAEAERVAAERRRALQAASEAAAAKQAQLARIEADRQAAAEREAQVEDRLQGARLREAERPSAGFELASRAEAERLAAERRRALQAAAEAAAEKKAATEREAQVEDHLQGARLREAQRASAGFELERRAEAERVAAERRRALQAASEAAAAEQAKLAQIEADRQAAAAEREAQVEDRLQGARLREAQRASAGFELERRAEAEQTTTGSISRSDRSEIRMAGRSAADDERGQFKRLSDGRHAAKNAQPGSNDFAGLGGLAKRIRRTIAPSADLDRKGVPRAGDRQRSASEGDDQGAFSGAAPSVVATLSESGGPRSRRILQHRCASILQDSDEYDDDLVSLCRTWGAGDRAAAR